MYSVILMAAVAGTPDAAGFGWRTGGCGGCYGAYATGCVGSACYGSGCYGSSCLGSSCLGSSCLGSCHGGALFPRLRNLFGGHSCRGSACYGSSCYGSCYGSGYGVGCYGSCYGSGYGVGCWGSCYGTGCGGYIATPVPAVSSGEMGGATETVTANRIAEPAKAPARLTVEVPTGAKLFVDGMPVTGEGSARLYHTPELPAGQAFFYDFKAEVVVNGSPVVEETRTVVRAGDSITVSFPKLVAALGGATEPVAAAK